MWQGINRSNKFIQSFQVGAFRRVKMIQNNKLQGTYSQ